MGLVIGGVAMGCSEKINGAEQSRAAKGARLLY